MYVYFCQHTVNTCTYIHPIGNEKQTSQKQTYTHKRAPNEQRKNNNSNSCCFKFLAARLHICICMYVRQDSILTRQRTVGACDLFVQLLNLCKYFGIFKITCSNKVQYYFRYKLSEFK